MKVFVVLALALCSACNANMLWQEPAKTNLEMVQVAFWDYVAKATQTAEESLEQIKLSALGQELNTRISQSADAVNQYTVALQTQVAPLSQELLAKLSQEAELLKTRLDAELANAGAQLQPYAMELKEELRTRMEALTKEVTPYAQAMDVETLRATVEQRSQELKERLDQSIQGFQSQMGPLADNLRQKMDQSMVEFQKNMEPLTQNFQAQVVQKSQEIQQSLTPLGEELKAKLNVNAQDLQNQLAQLWTSFTEKIQ